MFEETDVSGDQKIDYDEFVAMLKQMDRRLKSLPATAQVASQQVILNYMYMYLDLELDIPYATIISIIVINVISQRVHDDCGNYYSYSAGQLPWRAPQ